MDGMNTHKFKTRVREKTSANHHDPVFPLLMMAINPALIMAMVGSLVFFLLHLMYAGEFETRINYVFSLFVFATVLIARIAIEEGKEQALPFGLALAIAIGMVLLRFQLNVVLTVLLVSTVWWCVHRLTWDCTVLANDPEGPGHGLLRSIRLAQDAVQGGPSPSEQTTSSGKSHPASPTGVARRWWWIVAGTDRRPQAPGTTILWFALAAFPLFGIGSLFSVSARGSRQYAFLLFFVYIASGLGLLVTTGLLRLQQYLAKRQVEISAQTTGSWLIAGAGLTLFLLFASMLFPRPGAEFSLSRPPAWPQLNRMPPRGTSTMAAGNDGWEQRPENVGASERHEDQDSEHESVQPQSSAQAAPPTTPPQNEGDSPQNQGDSPQPQSSAQTEAPTTPPQNEGDSPQPSGRTPDVQAQEQTTQTEPDPNNDTPPAGSSDTWQAPFQFSIGNFFHWLFHIAFWSVVAVLAWRARHSIAAAVGDLWQAWKALFRRSKPKNVETSGPTSTILPSRRFAECENPFRSSPNLPPAVIVRKTLEALEVWAAERGYQRALDQTVDEFARQLSVRRKDLRQELSLLLELHTQLAYAGQTVSAQETLRLRRLWQILGRGD